MTWVRMSLFYICWFTDDVSSGQLINDFLKQENKKPLLQTDTPTPSVDTRLIKYLHLVTGKTAHGQNGQKWPERSETEISEPG